ncbi:MAG: CRISPR-associated protein Csx3 [Planctomycetaceae bacterium]|nr:CRISPR-associated protein Csx3 [Planctomycetaceae bacterium]
MTQNPEPQPKIPRGAVVIIEGRAPVWRYGMAQQLLSAMSKITKPSG